MFVSLSSGLSPFNCAFEVWLADGAVVYEDCGTGAVFLRQRTRRYLVQTHTHTINNLAQGSFLFFLTAAFLQTGANVFEQLPTPPFFFLKLLKGLMLCSLTAV